MMTVSNRRPSAAVRPRSALRARLGFAACAVLALQPIAAQADTIRVPQVKPIPDNGNLPLNSAVFTGSRDYGDFARYGYVEEEYYISGTASTRDEETAAVVKANLPYVSRIIVRRPANPGAFSGNVVVEPLHGLMEKSEMWEQAHGYMERNGDVWVGVTVKAKGADMDIANAQNLGGVPLLKIYDPVRYAALVLEEDTRPLHPAPPAPTPPQGIDLTMQVGALFKQNKGPLPKGFAVKRAFAIGGGINGEIVSGIVRTGQHQAQRLPNGKPIFDGYFGAVNNRYIAKPPKDAVYAMFHSENEATLEANLGYVGKEPDTPFYKVYNVPGTAHLGSRNFNPSSQVQANAVLPNPARGVNVAMDSAPCPNMNDDPVDVFMAAILARVEKAAKDGTPLPPAPLVELAAGDPGATIGSTSGAGLTKRVATLKRDPVSGNVIGGVRMPWVEAPIANYDVPADLFVKLAALAAMLAHGGPPGGPPGGPGGPPGRPGGPPPGAPGGPGAGERSDVIHSRPAGMAMPETPPVLAPSDSWQRASKEPIPGSKNRPAFCLIFTPRVAYDQATLRKLYPSYAAYVAKFDAAKANAVKQGWILPEEAATLRPRGRPEDF